MTGLKLLTLNMQNGQKWDPADPDSAPIDLDGIINFIEQRNPDIFFLQEVEFPDSEYPDTGTSPNYDRLASHFDEYYSYFSYPETDIAQIPFGIGLAIFSRYELLDPFHIVLPPADIEFTFQGRQFHAAHRSLIGADILVDGRQLILLNTHLQAYFMIQSSSDDHPQQRNLLEHVIRKRQETPLILAGDFNCAPDEGTIAQFEAAGLTSAQKGEITWYRMPYVLDHIMFSNDFSLKSVEVPGLTISDHKPVIAELELG